MLIPIESRDGKAQEWVLVELQGRVESLTSEEVSQIGVLLAGQDGKTLQLTVGYHQLEGKKVPLKKPLAILSKVQREGDQADAQQQQQQEPSQPLQPQGSNPEAMDVSQPQGTKQTAYEVLGVVRYQYLFKTRPRALISKPQGQQGLR